MTRTQVSDPNLLNTNQNNATITASTLAVPVNSRTASDSIIMYTVKDIQDIFKCSKDTAYQLVNANGFPSIRIGAKILTEKTALEKWIAKNAGKSIILR